MGGVLEGAGGGLEGGRGGIAARRWKHSSGGLPGLQKRCSLLRLALRKPFGECGPSFSLSGGV